jgi:hypothetical protein
MLKPENMKSKLFTLDTRDLINGLLLAFIAAVLTGILELLQKGAVLDWPALKAVLIAGIIAAISYFLKSLATNSRNQLFTREP